MGEWDDVTDEIKKSALPNLLSFLKFDDPRSSGVEVMGAHKIKPTQKIKTRQNIIIIIIINLEV